MDLDNTSNNARSTTNVVDHHKEYDIKQAFFTNLLLLGFEARAHEVKYRIPFNKDMFNLPNKVASEAVLYFLFEKLNPIMCKEEFRCIFAFPITNRADEQKFRHVCCNWLSNIQKEEPEAHLPRVAASLFMSPGGDKFYQLLFFFSTYVLHQVLKRENGVKKGLMYSELNHRAMSLLDVIGKTRQCLAIRHRKRFFQQLQQNLVANNEWKEYSCELVKDYRQTTKRIRELEREVRAERQKTLEKSAERGSPVSCNSNTGFSLLDFDLESQGVRRTQRIQKVRDMWRQLETSKVNDNSKDRETMSAILDQVLDKQKKVSVGISASELDVKIPDLLLRECEAEIHRRKIDNPYKRGDLNLLSVLQLWNVALNLYIEHLHQGKIPELEGETAEVTRQLHSHHALLTNTQSIRDKLSTELLPELKGSIERLQSQREHIPSVHKTPNTSRATCLGFELLAPTPPLSFTPHEDSRLSSVNKYPFIDGNPSQEVSTPEAASQIIDTVLQTSRRTANRQHHASPVYVPRISGSIPTSNRNINTNSKLAKNVSVKDKLPSKFGKVEKKPATISTTVTNKSLAEPKPSGVRKSTPLRPSHIGNKTTTRTATPITSTKNSTRAVSTGSPYPVSSQPSRGSSYNTPAKTSLPQSHLHLIDKIVSAVVDSSPDQPVSTSPAIDINLLNPLAALDDYAFQSKDKIRRSPDDGNKENEDKQIEQILQMEVDNTRQKLTFDNEPIESFGEPSIGDKSQLDLSTRKILTISDQDDSGTITTDCIGRFDAQDGTAVEKSPKNLNNVKDGNSDDESSLLKTERLGHVSKNVNIQNVSLPSEEIKKDFNSSENTVTKNSEHASSSSENVIRLKERLSRLNRNSRSSESSSSVNNISQLKERLSRLESQSEENSLDSESLTKGVSTSENLTSLKERLLRLENSFEKSSPNLDEVPEIGKMSFEESFTNKDISSLRGNSINMSSSSLHLKEKSPNDLYTPLIDESATNVFSFTNTPLSQDMSDFKNTSSIKDVSYPSETPTSKNISELKERLSRLEKSLESSFLASETIENESQSDFGQTKDIGLFNEMTDLNSKNKRDGNTSDRKSTNVVNDDLLNFDGLDLMNEEMPDLVKSPKMSEVPRTNRTSGIEELTSVDLDGIFNTKTPKLIRRTTSGSVGTVEKMQSGSFHADSSVFVSGSEESPITLVSYSPPDRPDSLSHKLFVPSNHNPARSAQMSTNDVHENSVKSIATDVETSVIDVERLDVLSLADDLLEDEDFPDMLNESFAPLRDGLSLMGATPVKAQNVKQKSSDSPNNSIFNKSASPAELTEHYRQLRKETTEVLSQVSSEIDDVIARAENSILDKERQLSLSGHGWKDTSFKQKGLLNYSADKKLSDNNKENHFLSASQCIDSCTDDIFAEDDSLLIPVSSSYG